MLRTNDSKKQHKIKHTWEFLEGVCIPSNEWWVMSNEQWVMTNDFRPYDHKQCMYITLYSVSQNKATPFEVKR